jgi:hypothetical protein
MVWQECQLFQKLSTHGIIFGTEAACPFSAPPFARRKTLAMQDGNASAYCPALFRFAPFAIPKFPNAMGLEAS